MSQPILKLQNITKRYPGKAEPSPMATGIAWARPTNTTFVRTNFLNDSIKPAGSLPRFQPAFARGFGRHGGQSVLLHKIEICMTLPATEILR
jgi:hypothetical protein